MNKGYSKLVKCYEQIKGKLVVTPKVAIVLGSGLGDYAGEIQVEQVIDYHEIEGFPTSTVAGHKGRFILGYIGKVPVVAMQGRVHYYEGYSMGDVVLPIRLMKLMGAEVLILTNAAGGVNFNFAPGDLMVITDHISSFVPSPLVGENIEELGTRFPDMSDIYKKELCQLIVKVAKERKIAVKEGVYMQLTGPNYESKAEIRMCRTLGADAVGMSTACEAMAANHMGMKVCGISCISNLACGMSDSPLNHLEVQETADKVGTSFKELVTHVVLGIERKL